MRMKRPAARSRLRRQRSTQSRRMARETNAKAAAFAWLRRLKQRFARYIGKTYGHLAADCAVCPTPCCADAQFVNVHIVRLEAEAMLETLRRSPKHGPDKVREVLARAHAAVVRYGLTETGDTFAQTYACPLFEPGVGCLVHWKASRRPAFSTAVTSDGKTCPKLVRSAQSSDRSRRLTKPFMARPPSGCPFRSG